jgi:hypothetical protein
MNTWPDGTPKSHGNAFSLGGSSTIGKEIQVSANRSKTVTKSVNRMLAQGKDVSTIPGLSDRSEKHERNPKRFHIYSKAKA